MDKVTIVTTDIFTDWFRSLRDVRAQARIQARIAWRTETPAM
jgi:putative component of toxin-antitoxin plasmid stabilization module